MQPNLRKVELSVLMFIPQQKTTKFTALFAVRPIMPQCKEYLGQSHLLHSNNNMHMKDTVNHPPI